MEFVLAIVLHAVLPGSHVRAAQVCGFGRLFLFPGRFREGEWLYFAWTGRYYSNLI